MTGFAASAGAQVSAELRSRLRSPSTLAALALLFAGSVLWIPNPAGNASSLSWTLPDGRAQGPVYDAAYIGYAVAVLVSIFVPLVGFYLVAGSVRRDRESGVGAILAATPLTRGQYLSGKLAAHVAYLSATVGLSLVAGLVAWIRFGSGPFSLGRFAGPALLFGLPAVVMTAALAVFFDVAPVLRTGVGLVVWFFAFVLLLVALPFAFSASGPDRPPTRMPVLDPAGAATEHWLAREAVPEGLAVSSGLVVREGPLERVAWRGLAVTPSLVATRAGNLLLALAPLLAAVLLFDRFDPSRHRQREGRRRGRGQAAGDAGTAAATERATAAALPAAPVLAAPSAVRAILAEALLVFDTAPLLKWPLLASSLSAAAVPAPALPGLAAAFFLLLVPVVSETAARESIAGTGGLVFSQPGVPRSAVLWKAASVAVFLVAVGSALLARRALAGPPAAAAFLAGLLFVAAASVGLGALTDGGKLFSGAFLTLWYAAASGVAGADFAGVFGPGRGAASAAWLAIGLGCLAAAVLRERATR